jgi:Fe-S oxidoreductase
MWLTSITTFSRGLTHHEAEMIEILQETAIGETLNQPRYCCGLAGSQLIKRETIRYMCQRRTAGVSHVSNQSLSDVILTTAMFILTFNI